MGLLAAGQAHAQAAEPVADSGATAWRRVASALVLLKE
jgi:ammonium transporter, Amt family